MPAAGRSTNTMTEVLTDILRQLAVAKTMPDADLEFLVELETMILGKLRSPLEAAAGQMGPAGPSVPPGPAGPGMDAMMPMAPPADTPIPPPEGGPPGLRTQPPMPSPDELSRLMAG